MKEIQPTHKETIQIVKQADQEKIRKFEGRLRPRKGQKVFEVNLAEGTIGIAIIEKSIGRYRTPQEGNNPRAHYERLNEIVKNPVITKIKVKEHCIYIAALNKKNAVKKLIKAGIIK